MWVMCTSTLPSSCASSCAERRRAQVAADAGQLALVVAEGGLDHQVGHLHRPRAAAHSAGFGPVSPVKTHQPARAAVDARSRPPARCARPAAPRCASPPSSASSRRRRRARSASDRLLGARQAGEVGPDHAVEDVRAQRRQRLGQRVHADRRPALGLAQRGSRCRPAGRSTARGRGASGVIRMWSMRASSSSVRSPTPVPASIRTSSSSRNDVVRQPAAMEPEQPST